MRLSAVIAVMGIGFLATGCASIIDGNTQSISFAPNPDSATVTLNGAPIGKTPVTVPIKRQAGAQTLKFSKEGFKDHEVPLTTTLNPWFLGNLVTGGLLGSTTDGLSGAAFKYAPGQYMVTLQPDESTPLPGGMSFNDSQKIVNFIVMGYAKIVGELTTTPGQYTTSLLEMAAIPQEKRPEMIKKLKALSELYDVIPEFAEKSAELLQKK